MTEKRQNPLILSSAAAEWEWETKRETGAKCWLLLSEKMHPRLFTALVIFPLLGIGLLVQFCDYVWIKKNIYFLIVEIVNLKQKKNVA
jgi:hypothetical protein